MYFWVSALHSSSPSFLIAGLSLSSVRATRTLLYGLFSAFDLMASLLG